MKIGILNETLPGENRVSVSPTVVAGWVKKGMEVRVEKGAGARCAMTDKAFADAGATIATTADVLNCDVVCAINPLATETLKQVPSTAHIVALMYHKSNTEYVQAANASGAGFFSLDAIPRISRAQSMDVLSSQANLAGYKAVIMGANNMQKIFPLMMTAAGTITPARVLIFGVGVAGLQAIATAKRLGAIVEATDVRPETKEQVESLGGKFIEVKDASVGSEGGYAKEATDEYRAKQREAVNKSLALADLVITTAQVPGRKAPVLIDEEQLALMKNGAVVVDMAAAQGGNCCSTQSGAVVNINGVIIDGTVNLPSTLAVNASELFARNMDSFLQLITKDGELAIPMDDEIVKASLICHNGQILVD